MRDDDEKRLLEGDMSRTSQSCSAYFTLGFFLTHVFFSLVCLGSVVRLLPADLTKNAAQNYAASSISMLCAYTIPESAKILASSGPQEPTSPKPMVNFFMTRACTIFKYAYPLKASPWSAVSIILPRCEHWSALCDSIPADLTFFGGLCVALGKGFL
jgi:hypothetical protein